MEYQRFVLGDLRTNCYLLWSESEAGIIDPGGDPREVEKFIHSRGLNLKWIVNTHGHADHIAGNRSLYEKYHIPIMIHEADRPMLTSSAANLSVYIGMPITSPDAERLLQHGEVIPLGAESLTVIATPGHTPGGISLYTEGLLFSGDSLFRETIGRTDLPGGDHWLLLKSIREHLLTLPPTTKVLPGHESETTIAYETKYNPFFDE